MTIYCVMLLSVICISSTDSRVRIKVNEERRWLYSLIPLAFVACFRYGIGTDYYNYQKFFNYVLYSSNWKVEWLFKLLSQYVTRIFGDTRFTFAFFALVILFLIGFELKENSVDFGESLFLFITLGYFFGSLNILRQYVAMAVVFFATRFLYKKKNSWFYVAVVLAAGIHRSALVTLLLPFLFNRHYSIKMYITIVVFSLIIPILRQPITNVLMRYIPQYAGYIRNDTGAMSSLEIMTNMLMHCAFLILGLPVVGKTDDSKFLIPFNCIFASFLFYSIGSFLPNINRISLYYEIYLIEYIPYVLHRNEKHSRRNKRIINVFCLLIFFFAVGYLGRYGVIPYRSWL